MMIDMKFVGPVGRLGDGNTISGVIKEGIYKTDIELTDEQIRKIIEREWVGACLDRVKLYDSIKRDESVNARFTFDSIEYIYNTRFFIMGEEGASKLLVDYFYKTTGRLVAEIRFYINAGNTLKARYLMDEFMDAFGPLINNLKPKVKE